jgi:hypothetical protein
VLAAARKDMASEGLSWCARCCKRGHDIRKTMVVCSLLQRRTWHQKDQCGVRAAANAQSFDVRTLCVITNEGAVAIVAGTQMKEQLRWSRETRRWLPNLHREGCSLSLSLSLSHTHTHTHTLHQEGLSHTPPRGTLSLSTKRASLTLHQEGLSHSPPHSHG